MPLVIDRFLRLRRRRAGGLSVDPSLGSADLDRLARSVDDLLVHRDRAGQRTSAARVLHTYGTLDTTGRRRFLAMLAERFSVDEAAVDAAAEQLRTAEPGPSRRAAERAMRQAITPRHLAFLRLVTGLPGGVKLLVDLRADLLPVRREDPSLAFLDDELVSHLSSLFDVGLLELRRISWEATPAAVLESLMAYEAVHEIAGWDDLRNRLDSDRRCYAYFHPAMPGEPLVFVEIALTEGIAERLPPLLDLEATNLAPEEADTAIFYSISNCQPGLAGVALGNELIKHVVEELRRDFHGLRMFATLSPIPGFRAWAEARIGTGDLSQAEKESLGDRIDPGDQRWLDRARPALLSLAARYLTQPVGGRAADQVANFHLSNGASVERIDWLANPADYGMDGSFGLMVNYRYDLDRIGSNTVAYLDRGVITASKDVRSLIR
ncbi:MAG TPA: malonyl-CoA decarboxylase family protein [Acidimicrobiales bacterium]|jgi:malonyl-CoA decarboxylase